MSFKGTYQEGKLVLLHATEEAVYRDAKPTCSECHGTGWLPIDGTMVDLPGGRYFDWERCSCLEELQ